MIRQRLRPFLIGVTCWLIGMIGYWLTTVGFTALGGSVALVAVLVFPYGFYLAFKRVKEHFANPPGPGKKSA
jgi:hypothetical protein